MCTLRISIAGQVLESCKIPSFPLFFAEYASKNKLYFIAEEKYHTIRKFKKVAGQNTFPILLLNDANMIEEH